MKVRKIENGTKLWQFVAIHFRPQDNPYHRFARDEEIDRYQLATIGINQQPLLAPLTLHSVFTLSSWPGGFNLAVPEDGEVYSFPQLGTPQEVAENIGYGLDGEVTAPVRPPPISNVPAWVLRYWERLAIKRNQLGLADLFGTQAYLLDKVAREKFLKEYYS